MGSENSKQGAAPQRKEEERVIFDYGPKTNKTTASKTTVNQIRAQPPIAQVAVTKNAPPPPYSYINPSTSSASSNSELLAKPSTENQVINRPVPLPRTAARAVQQKQCLICLDHLHETAHCPLNANYANNVAPAGLPYQPPKVAPKSLPPTIPPLPNKQHVNSQYKWTPGQSQGQNASLPLQVNVTQPLEQKPASKKTPSPTYDSLRNPYVWTPSPPAVGLTKVTRIIDLDLEIPKINQRIKDNQLPNFQHFNKQLSKNKPLTDTRLLMMNNKYLSDVTFIVGDSIFYAHKMILITASFLFYEHFHVKAKTEMKIESINFETFEKVISYCYTDQIKVTEDDVLEVLLASNQLQVRQIVNVCHGLISNLMNDESIFVIFEKALELNNAVFQKKCLDFIMKNEEKCFSSKGFFAITLPALMKILVVCNYPRGKVSEIIEKWTIGDMGSSAPEPKANASVSEPPVVSTQTKGAVKKPPQKKKQPAKNKQKTVPDLMSLQVQSPHSGPPSFPPFPYPPPHMQQHFPHPNMPNFMSPMQLPRPNMHQTMNFVHQTNPVGPVIRPVRPFARSCSNLSKKTKKIDLISFDDEDDKASMISKDDELDAKLKVGVLGTRHKWLTEISRLDLVCKRSMLLHEIWFSENLAPNCKEVSVTVSVFDNGKKSDLNVRPIKITKPMLNVVRYNHEPLKIYVGQKFFIKLKFNDTANRLNVNAEGLTPNSMMELNSDADTKKYFNCISALQVSELP